MAYDNDDHLTGYEEHVRDSSNLGDARRCQRHPHVKTSSDDGMFDGVCGECEAEMADAADREDPADRRIRQEIEEQAIDSMLEKRRSRRHEPDPDSRYDQRMNGD